MNNDINQLTETKKRLFELMMKKKQQAGKSNDLYEKITGDVVVTPSQAEEFNIYNPDRHIFNISILVEVETKLTRSFLEALLEAIINHHDALRLCSVEEETGWRQFIASPLAEVPLSYYDFSQVPVEKHKELIEEHAALLQKSFNLSTGPLLKAAYFNLGENTPDRLMFLVHHIGCDHYSIIILLEDTITALNQLKAGVPVQLPKKTTSIQSWARRLKEHSQSNAIKEELPYWLNEERKTVPPMPVDYPAGVNLGKDMVLYSQAMELGKESSLSPQILAKKNLQIHDIVIAATVMALTDWTGGTNAHISLCHHGRNHNFSEIDISRTVGFFSYQYPLYINIEGCCGPDGILEAVKNQIKNVPNHGLNYGILRYLAQDEIRKKFTGYPEPELFLNIRIGSASLKLPGFKFAEESMGSASSETIIRPRYIYLNVDVEKEKIALNCQYNTNIHKRKSIQNFISNYINKISVLEKMI
ncbi:MAG: condensation domain-containing protein [Clostridia bacterium]|nr:condensation domain-containing protein [Clostridia bacterium]